MKFHRNPFYLALLAVIGLVSLGYSFHALYRCYQYVRLSSEVPASGIEWSVQEVSDNEYLVKGSYTFSNGREEVRGTTLFYDDPHLNPWAAEQAVKGYAERKWNVWYRPPEGHVSSLQKKFPLKECLSTAAMWVIWLYFLWLGLYVARKEVS